VKVLLKTTVPVTPRRKAAVHAAQNETRGETNASLAGASLAGAGLVEAGLVEACLVGLDREGRPSKPGLL
jgi:hypothetical protein